MKKLTTLIAILLCTVTLIAQAPEKFTYQAVVRNASNSLVSNTQVGVRVSLLQGSATGNAVYVETQSTTTNTNGLLSMEIGGGTVQQGTFADIDWASGPFFLKTEIDPNGGTNYSITSTQQMLSVPYALYAKESGNGFSGDYNDLTNTPTIPTVPTNVSAFTNDAGYITMDSVPAIPTNVSAFSNDAGYITGYTETDPQFNAWNKDYNDLINRPTIPTVPTNVSAFNNDAGYITMDSVPAIPTNVSAFSNDAGYITGYTETDPQFNAWNTDYNDLINTPTIPTVPTNVSAFSNDAGYLTSYTETDPQFNAWNKDYNDLINTPTIPTVPTNVSAFSNDAGYITMDSVPAIPTNVSAFTNDAGYITTTHCGGMDICTMVGQLNTLQQQIENLQAQIDSIGLNTDTTHLDYDCGVNLNVSASATSICAGEHSTLYVTQEGWSGNVTYLWDANADNSTATTVDVQPTETTTYHLTATVSSTSGTCTAEREVTIVVTPRPTDLVVTADNDIICEGQQITFVASASSLPVTDYIWYQNGVEIPGADLSVITVNFNEVGYYAYAYKAIYEGCVSVEASDPIVVTVTPAPTTVSITGCNVVSGNNTTTLTAYSDVDGMFFWSTGSNELSIQASVGVYNVTIVTPEGCSKTSENFTVMPYDMPFDTSNIEPIDTTNIEPTFTCGISTVSDYDGNVYPTVQIGDQCWMKENLRTTHYSDGTLIAPGTTASSTVAYHYNSYHYASGVFFYIDLYNWKAVMRNFSSSQANPSGVQGICPTGWHVPSYAEWEELVVFVRDQSQFWCDGDSFSIAKSLGAKSGWDNSTNNCAVGYNQNSNNATGFSALPTGCFASFDYYHIGSESFFWSATESEYYSTDRATYFGLNYDNDYVYCPATYKSEGLSVRCLRDY